MPEPVWKKSKKATSPAATPAKSSKTRPVMLSLLWNFYFGTSNRVQILTASLQPARQQTGIYFGQLNLYRNRRSTWRNSPILSCGPGTEAWRSWISVGHTDGKRSRMPCHRNVVGGSSAQFFVGSHGCLSICWHPGFVYDLLDVQSRCASVVQGWRDMAGHRVHTGLQHFGTRSRLCRLCRKQLSARSFGRPVVGNIQKRKRRRDHGSRRRSYSFL